MKFPAQYAKSHRFTCGSPRTFTFGEQANEPFVLFLRSKGPYDATLCLWKVDETGKEYLLVDPKSIHISSAATDAEKALRERFRESAAGITAYNCDETFQFVCFALEGSLFIYALATDTLHTIETAGSVFDPRISPDGLKVAYVSDTDLFVAVTTVDQPWREITQRTIATSDVSTTFYGKAEFIAAEEMRRTRGFWWSPQSDALLATKVDESHVSTWWISDPANPNKPARPVHYPAAGTNNAHVTLHHFTLTGESSRIEWASDPQNIDFEYLADVLWQKNSDPLLIRQTRDQKMVDVAHIKGQTCSSIHRIENDVWVELHTPSLAANQLCTIEKTEDANGLFLDGVHTPTDGYQIRTLVASDAKRIICTAWTTPSEIHVLSIDKATQQVTQLTNMPGTHNAVVRGNQLLLIQSVLEAPHASVTWHYHDEASSDNRLISIASLAVTPVVKAEPQLKTLGQRALASAIFTPHDHDGTSTLPVIVDPYGGPHAQRVLASHNSHLASQWLADQGFAVLVTDGRGTPGRGPSWEHAIYGDLATPVLEDQIDALTAAARQHSFFDMTRVGIKGWSFGGYLAALAVVERPDIFKAAIAGAPVTDWRLYDTHYTERYLGHPEKEQQNYERCDLLTKAHTLQNPLLLIHGLADDNVVAAHTLQLSSALLVAGAQHSVLPLSGVTHMTPEYKVAENLLHTQANFFQSNL